MVVPSGNEEIFLLLLLLLSLLLFPDSGVHVVSSCKQIMQLKKHHAYYSTPCMLRAYGVSR